MSSLHRDERRVVPAFLDVVTHYLWGTTSPLTATNNAAMLSGSVGAIISLWAVLSVPPTHGISQQQKLSPFGPGMRNAVMSGIQDSADFAVKIHPPVEDLDETLKSLDGIMMMEDAERRASNEDFVDAEQRLLAVHKAKIREIVAAAMEPIHAMFPVKFQEVMEDDNEL